MAVYISTWQIFLLHQIKLFDRSFLLHIMDGNVKVWFISTGGYPRYNASKSKQYLPIVSYAV